MPETAANIENGYEYSEHIIIDQNGGKYVVGVDQYGWLSIQAGEWGGTEDTQNTFYVYENEPTSINFGPDVLGDVMSFVGDHFDLNESDG